MLLHLAPSPVTRLHRAIAVRYAAGARAAMAELDDLAGTLDEYHLYHASRAELREQLPFLDNSANLAGFVTPRAPPTGARIRVTGPYVLDTNALHDLIVPGKNVADWAEIHPAWNITVSRRAR